MLAEEVKIIDDAFKAASEKDRVDWKEMLEYGGPIDVDLQLGTPNRFVPHQPGSGSTWYCLRPNMLIVCECDPTNHKCVIKTLIEIHGPDKDGQFYQLKKGTRTLRR